VHIFQNASFVAHTEPGGHLRFGELPGIYAKNPVVSVTMLSISCTRVLPSGSSYIEVQRTQDFL
jgi:hypothetical protein